MENDYPNVTKLREATTNYNCHSYAWHLQTLPNVFGISDPSPYMTDGSYTYAGTSPTANKQKVFYGYGDKVHSGIVTEAFMKKGKLLYHAVRYILLLLLLVLLAGCKKEDASEPDNDLSFLFDENGEYLGFQKIEDISAEDAAENGYVVFKDGCFKSGETLLDTFLAQAGQGEETQLRLYSLWHEDTEEQYVSYTDIFYRDSLYYAFKTGLLEGQKNTAAGYPYMLLLWETNYPGKKENSNNRQSFFLVLSNDPDIKYSDLIKDMLSSSSAHFSDRTVYWQIFWGSKET